MQAVSQLTELRQARGFTQQELARRMRVTVGIISRWETGTYTPRARNQKRLARILRVRLDELGFSEGGSADGVT